MWSVAIVVMIVNLSEDQDLTPRDLQVRVELLFPPVEATHGTCKAQRPVCGCAEGFVTILVRHPS